MEKSLFQNDSSEEKQPPTPFELIEKEIVHLNKNPSVRHGAKGSGRTPWIAILALLGLAWLYLMDPIYHAWYKGEAIRAYLYLHTYDAGPTAGNLLATGLFSTEEIDALNHRDGNFREYYKSPADAINEADDIINYLTQVKLLHKGDYKPLDPVGRMRCVLFVRTGLVLPTDWEFLDPSASN